jgi:hypothetical protein
LLPIDSATFLYRRQRATPSPPETELSLQIDPQFLENPALIAARDVSLD